jgi:ATP-dependent RNA helicase DHX37/DHR1
VFDGIRPFLAMSHREKFNSKARQSTAGPSRKKGKYKAVSTGAVESAPDPNAEILVPKTKEEQLLQKKEKLRAEVGRAIHVASLPNP